MIIDFDKIPEVHQMNFKGGKGALDTRNYARAHPAESTNMRATAR